jgi:hypothetical protein
VRGQQRVSVMQPSKMSTTSSKEDEDENETDELLAQFVDLMVGGASQSQLDAMLSRHAANEEFVRLAKVSQRLRAHVSQHPREPSSLRASNRSSKRSLELSQSASLRVPDRGRRNS